MNVVLRSIVYFVILHLASALRFSHIERSERKIDIFDILMSFFKSAVELVDHNLSRLNSSMSRSSVVTWDTENISDLPQRKPTLFGRELCNGGLLAWWSSGVMLILNARDQGSIPHWDTESFCLLKSTVIFGAQLQDSSTYCLFCEKCEDMLSSKGGECQSGQLL